MITVLTGSQKKSGAVQMVTTVVFCGLFIHTTLTTFSDTHATAVK